MCRKCIYYTRVGHDYGECQINPSFSSIGCSASCNDFMCKYKKPKKYKKERKKI